MHIFVNMYNNTQRTHHIISNTMVILNIFKSIVLIKLNHFLQKIFNNISTVKFLNSGHPQTAKKIRY